MAGNMTKEPGNRNYEYDAENRLKTVKNGTSTVATYGYDPPSPVPAGRPGAMSGLRWAGGDGRRVKKAVAGGETRWYSYDPAGRAVWEYKQGATSPWDTHNFHFNGKLTAVNSIADGLLWTHLDHLGTPRLKTDSTGGPAVRMGQQDRNWYYPFGEQINASVDGVKKRFTGQERDAESGLDYFGARHYSSSLGRFLTFDPAGWNLNDPQSLNRFAYAFNNPIRYYDPTGLYSRDFHHDLTAVLAQAAGFSESEAAVIAAADQGVDDRTSTGPFTGAPFGSLGDHHFTSPERRRELYNRALDNGSLTDLGIYLHAQQDSYAHAGLGSPFYQVGVDFWAMVTRGKSRDDTSRNAGLAVVAAEESYQQLVNFRRATGMEGPLVPFSTIRGYVYSFAAASSPTEKNFYLLAIRARLHQAEKSRSSGTQQQRSKQATDEEESDPL